MKKFASLSFYSYLSFEIDFHNYRLYVFDTVIISAFCALIHYDNIMFLTYDTKLKRQPAENFLIYRQKRFL